MKVIVLSLFAVVALCHMGDGKILMHKRGPPPIGPPKSTKAPEMNTIEQLLDHFNIFDDRTWQMRYLSNGEFFKAGAPMFIFLGGEWEISPGYVITGQMFDMAKKTNGMMYYTEHRYYGDSQPLKDLSSESLKYLSIDQALADVAYFIKDRKANEPGLENSKVVVVGGSYSATMATWMRLKYPSLVDAALSSSAPLLAIEDFYQYYEVVSKNIEINSPPCLSILQVAMAEITDQISSPAGKAAISTAFNTCKTVQDTNPHRAYFFSAITEIFAGLVQYARTGEIKQECDKIIAKQGTSMEKLGAYVRDQYGGDCMGDYDDFVEEYSSTEMSFDMYRQWFYQCCTEFAFWQTTSSSEQVFGPEVTVELYHNICTDLYGKEFTAELTQKGIERTNNMYGGLDIDVTHVMSVHGNVDPWHAIGVLHDINEISPTVVVNGTSHCADLGSISSNDLPELAAAKQRSQDEILRWIL